jgi:hypothetical protein
MVMCLAQATAAEVKVWTCDAVSDEMARDAVKKLRPVTLVGARNGAFSGKIVVESPAAIQGLKASASPLTGDGGTIAAANVQLRYAKVWDWKVRFCPNGLDMLMDAPSEVPLYKGRATVAVWVTVHVPKDAKPGHYAGEVTIEAAGLAPAKVPVKLEVADWTLPDPQDYRTWTDLVQSPDTLALEYNVPLWSEKHWALIDRSFREMAPTGTRVLYVPLITRTNFGNEQSMVRWIDKGDGRYEYDYTVMDRYLDSAAKNLGQPKMVIFIVWDIPLSMNSLNRGLHADNVAGKEIRGELLGKGPRVTAWDPKTKETKDIFLPRYEDAASRALWQPMFSEIRNRMARRGLEKTMMLGIMADLWPAKEEVTFWKDISGDLPWVIHAHGGPVKDLMVGQRALHKIADVGYAACVALLTYNVNPDKGRLYGWNQPAFLSGYLRHELNNDPPCFLREMQAFHITGGQRGSGRMGADFWPAVRDKSGGRAGQVYARYPEGNWRNLDISDWFLAPGPDGAVATARLEYVREGTQVCEARIVLEAALLNADAKAKLGDDLARRCQEALDAHHRAMWKTLWSDDQDLSRVGVAGGSRAPIENLWKAMLAGGKELSPFFSPEGRAMQKQERAKGEKQYAVGWQERERRLFVLAGEVANKLSR